MTDSMWPELDDLESRLQGIAETTVAVQTAPSLTDEHIDHILQELRRRRRGGPLGID